MPRMMGLPTLKRVAPSWTASVIARYLDMNDRWAKNAVAGINRLHDAVDEFLTGLLVSKARFGESQMTAGKDRSLEKGGFQ